MSLLDKIREKKSRLHHTETIVRTVEGKLIREEITDAGLKSGSISSTSSQPGYVVDMKPDLQVAVILDGLCMGSQDVTQDIELLRKHNITHIISVGINVEKIDKDIEYRFFEALDLPEFDIADTFDKIFLLIDNVRSNNKVVYVHCNAGVSRSASIIIGYVMKTLNFTFERAHEYVKARRECIKPNNGFVSQLKHYETRIHVNDG